MSKRFVDTDLWQKSWFQEMSIKEKILIKYIFENCDCAGVWDINLRMASFIIGETITLTDFYNINNKKELFKFIKDEQDNEKRIFVVDFITFQYGKLSYNCKPHLPVIKLLKKYGIDFETIDENNLTIKQQRRRLTAVAKEKIFIRDKYECQYCGSHEDLEIDHIIPLSKGGNNEDSNLITACHKCNNLKGDKDIKEFFKMIERDNKKLERVSKILDTLEEKEQEQYKEKEKEKEKDISIYGEYQNVSLSKEHYDKLLALCLSEKLLNELINSFSVNIEVGKERPYEASLPNAHYERLRSYYNFRKKNPDKFQQQKEEHSRVIDDWYKKEKARLAKKGIY